jgi:putative endonuclease
MPNKGRAGEEAAAVHLEKQGMRILERNFRSRKGEVDIIALDGETIIFAEVKSWSSYGIDALEQSLDTKKQRKIIETSKYFLSVHRKYRYMAIRFDVIFVSPKGITHLASAFTECI